MVAPQLWLGAQVWAQVRLMRRQLPGLLFVTSVIIPWEAAHLRSGVQDQARSQWWLFVTLVANAPAIARIRVDPTRKTFEFFITLFTFVIRKVRKTLSSMINTKVRSDGVIFPKGASGGYKI